MTISTSGSWAETRYGKRTAGIGVPMSLPATERATGRFLSRSTEKDRGVITPPQPWSMEYAVPSAGAARPATRTRRDLLR